MSLDPIPAAQDFDPATLIVKLSETIEASVPAIDPVVDRIVAAVRDMGCAAGKEHEVDLALREALTNAVVHGCKEDPAQTVHIWVLCDDTRGMLIVVRDSGQGFDPRSIPSPTTGEGLYASHGRGVFLINELMDDVRFTRGGTEIHMRKR